MYAEGGSMDSQVTDAIYTGGVLKPLGDVSLHEAERVRLIIERTEKSDASREVALERLRAGIEQMRFFLSGPLPSCREISLLNAYFDADGKRLYRLT
jgi:predicted DNA-binding antitoxin AbrB/MazE fold protein